MYIPRNAYFFKFRSAVAAFLDLVEILIRAPDDPERIDKIHDIQIIFINMHHLLNEHRPLQVSFFLPELLVIIGS